MVSINLKINISTQIISFKCNQDKDTPNVFQLLPCFEEFSYKSAFLLRQVWEKWHNSVHAKNSIAVYYK